jgi:hypothetical protein
MICVTAVDFYRQTFDEPLLRWHATAFVERDVNNDGCAQVPCADGCRNGKYEEPDGNWYEHVKCKGTGLMWVNLW